MRKHVIYGAIMITLLVALGAGMILSTAAEETGHYIALSSISPQQAKANEIAQAQAKAKAEAEARRPKLTQADIDAALQQVMGDYSAVAVSVATIEKGQLSQCGAWGWAVKGEREMTADTKVRIASISKVVVGMNAMAMAEDGQLDLNAPLSTYWGNSVKNPYSKKQPTALTLMTHTSSLKDLETTGGLSKLKGMISSKGAWRSMEPGNGGYWFYSNFGFCVLGTTLELAGDRLLDDYAQERFFQTMDIKASFCGGKLEEQELATLYTTGGVGRSAAAHAGQKVPTQIGETAAYFPGGMTISAPDMAKMMCVLANDGVYNGQRYLSEQSVAAMETPQFKISQNGTPAQQCLVLRRQENMMGQDVLYYHTGSAYGVFSLMSYNPNTGSGVVVITTGTPRKTDDHGVYALCAQLSETLYEKMERSA